MIRETSTTMTGKAMDEKPETVHVILFHDTKEGIVGIKDPSGEDESTYSVPEPAVRELLKKDGTGEVFAIVSVTGGRGDPRDWHGTLVLDRAKREVGWRIKEDGFFVSAGDTWSVPLDDVYDLLEG